LNVLNNKKESISYLRYRTSNANLSTKHATLPNNNIMTNLHRRTITLGKNKYFI